jgi:hypothetical protein
MSNGIIWIWSYKPNYPGLDFGRALELQADLLLMVLRRHSKSCKAHAFGESD